MAAVQLRGDSYRLIFQYLGKQHSCTLGEISQTEAHQCKTRCEQLLMRVEQGLLEIPAGVAVADFILFDGKPPVDPAFATRKQTTLHELRKAYLKTYENGAIESNTLATARIHLTHIERTLGHRFLLSGISLGKLQEHINRRHTEVLPVTIKKEIDTFRTAWNWGLTMQWIDKPFPVKGLVYPKSDEKPPFMTWGEIKRRIRAGGDAELLWECLYLDRKEIEALLSYVRTTSAPDWVYPMLTTAAYTGARRSELIRALQEDIDLKARVLTIREKKRARGSRTTRRVPISAPLARVLRDWLRHRQGCVQAFGDGDGPLALQTVHKALRRVLDDSKWSVIKGWHVLRHSFISACAAQAIDQRFIDEWVGHCSEAMRRRYRHLYPSAQAAAIGSVFGY
jgi:integrase